MEVRFYPGALDALLNSPAGPVGDHLRTRTRLFISMARRQVGVDEGDLIASIRSDQHKRETYGQSIRIGSTVAHALMHHEGTKPHVIMSNSGRILSFSNNGRVITTKSVNHPGTRPNKYLADNLYIFRR